jgi:predicted amidohydrolase
MPLARQALHEDGEDIHIAAWPTVKETSLLASRHYAFEGRCFVIAVGSLLRAAALPPGLPAIDTAGPWVVRGGTTIIAPDAAIIAGPVYDQECTLLAECDLGRVREESLTLDVAGHYSRPDCFRLERLNAGRPLAPVPPQPHLPA